MLSLASAIILFVVFYQRRVIDHQQQIRNINEQNERELTKAAIRAEEEERYRIATELHDDVGSMLACVRLYLKMAGKQGSDGGALDQSQELIDQTIQKVRNLSRSLQPAATLQLLGLHKALLALFDVFNKSDVITIHYSGSDILSLNENTTLAIYRILQELVNNTLKHAHATIIWVSHTESGGSLEFRFSHNGKGITEETFHEYIYKKDASGLKNIVNRLKIVNGSISFDCTDEIYHTIMKIPL